MSEPEVTSPTFEPGQTIAGKYLIEEQIGAGGMGFVVAARHVAMGHKLAIKILRLGEETDPTGAVARFVREARAAARIESDHVVRVTDVGALPDGTPYMVMEYLEGEDLREIIHKRGELPIEEAVTLVLQACEGLAEAHASGVIHRDLKPSNLFLSRKVSGATVLKVLDFGISKVMPRAGEVAITTTTSLMGSPLYMAPEQMRSSKDVDARADVWSLGLILYELLAGSPPFEGETVPEVCVNVMGSPPLPMSRFRTDVPDGLLAVLSRCMAKSRDDRYPTMGALARALEPFAGPRAGDHAERASAAAKSARAHMVSDAGVDYAPTVIVPVVGDKTLPSQKGPADGGIVLPREPAIPPTWPDPVPRSRARKSGVTWILIAVPTCIVAALFGAIFAQSNPPPPPPAAVARPASTVTAARVTPAQPAPAAPPSAAQADAVDLPSVPFDSLPVAARDAGATHAVASVGRKPSPPSPPPAGSASAGKEGWKWGDRN